MSKFRRQGTGQSVRGKTISHPIPFPDDDEFPIRTPGAGIALPLGSDAENQIRIRESVAAQLENTSHQTGIAVSDFIDPTVAAQSEPMPIQPSPEAPMRRTNQPSHLRNSTVSKTTGSSVGRPQRKKSTIRAVFGRLFGKRRKGSGSSSSKEQGPSEIRAGQHRSDPTALNRSPPASSQKRSASLPINEFNRALRSHSIVADDFPLGSTENEGNRGSVQADGQRRPRRATTPSRLWTPTKTPGYVDWTGLSPRPASTHGRGSKAISDAVADANIGTAVTSGSHPNRRSRSLGELRDVAGTQTPRRRRSDEIRYWRESYDPGVLSPMSSNKAETEEPILVEEGDDARDAPPQEPPQPFIFEMAGMKITQAASLETRVQRLEERMMQMERMVSSRNYQRPEETIQFQDSPRRGSASKRSTSITRPQTDNSDISLPRQYRYRDAPPRPQARESRPPGARGDLGGSQIRSSSYGSSRPSTISTHNSYHPSFENFPLSTAPTSEMPAPPTNTTNFARPLSTSTTIRGIPSSSPTFTNDSPLTGEHYTALTNMILAEQAARHDLENVVHSLQRQLQAYLSSHSGTTSYPTPGSDAAGDPISVTAGEFSAFEQDDSSEDEGRFRDEHGEVFQTPSEERQQFGDEIFGEVGRDEGKGEGRKSAPRTLSLSQITMQHSVNF
ncbi:hypothetical protein BDZ45DRAFT_610373 [Acephala macrosclerotiorum]|nr:hypothetical protein BDZ45DRAFT_610373 [Acephala macrosclerotiorum]